MACGCKNRKSNQEEVAKAQAIREARRKTPIREEKAKLAARANAAK